MRISLLASLLACTLSGQALATEQTSPAWRNGQCGSFTIAAIPDSQNYLDFRHQRSAGFPVDGHRMFQQQIRWIADNAASNGGNIVFATHLGDIWQNRVQRVDPGHAARGLIAATEAQTDGQPAVFPDGVRNHEIPMALASMQLLDGALPFSIVPGNHDYDAVWVDHRHLPDPDNAYGLHQGIRHFGGLDGFRSVFSDQSPLFKDKPWYVASNDGGADSAQLINAGQCQLLHIGLQFDAPDSSLAWARRVIKQHPGVPTIVTTHKFTDRAGRFAVGGSLDMSLVDPQDNNPQMVWDDFISQHDQIFLVLSGHIGGQGHGIARNDEGNLVHHLLSDFQPRGQVARQAAPQHQGKTLTGDGWLRLLQFNLDDDNPSIHVRTYSTHYGKYSTQVPDYGRWYKEAEQQSHLSDAQFRARDDFRIALDGFHQRFAR
ncbi:hypothetical protein [Stenotrophomonas koreensis]|uniref:hypothetical protein n=1 Tax=Stenotrophomonas koreensis TaxID=266128 RepID=UPI00070F9281|nr:hypothetical protein [Stenotrophomonas koreensis]